MTRKIVLLNLALLALAGVLGWRMRAAWLEEQQKQREMLVKTAKPAAVLPPPAAPAVEAARPADYIDVAQRTLFSRDRDPNVVIIPDAPPPPPPPPVRPPLPHYYGQMALGEPVVILSLDGKQKRYRAGDKISEFTIVEWDQSSLTFDWNGAEVRADLDSLKPPPEEIARNKGPKAAKAAKGKSAPANTNGAVAQVPVAAKAEAAPRANTGQMGGKSKEESAPELGRPVGAFRTCVAGDSSPAGTVKDGFRKVVTTGLMGPECHWEPIN